VIYVSVVLWDLSESDQTVVSLRSFLRNYAVDHYTGAEGLRSKLWVSSTGPEGETWGSISLWDNWQATYAPPPDSKLVPLIGYLPTSRSYFSVEAAAEGVSSIGALAAGLGSAYESGAMPPLARPQELIPPNASKFIRSFGNR
jgi:hypothetical protein